MTLHDTPTANMKNMKDFVITNHGTIFLVYARTQAARDWLHEVTDGTWLGDQLAVEHRFIGGLAAGTVEEGWTVDASDL